MLLCYRIQNREVSVFCDAFNKNANNTKKYLEQIESYYYTLTGELLSVDIFQDDEIPALCISEKERIIFHSKLINLKDIAMFLYFPHEIFHQTIGNNVRFSGKGKSWMLESFTEYLQWRYISTINRSFSKRLLEFYLGRYKSFIEYDVSLLEAKAGEDVNKDKASIESRGVLLCIIYLQEKGDVDIYEAIRAMISIKVVEVEDFLECFKLIGVNSEALLENAIKANDYYFYEEKIRELGLRI